MANEDNFCFLFFPGDYLRDTQNLSQNAQVAYDRIMCEHVRKICITQQQQKFFTKRLSDDERDELSMVLEGNEAEGYYIPWVKREIEKRLEYSEGRRNNRLGKTKEKPPKKKKRREETYVPHMEKEKELEIVNELELETEQYTQYPEKLRQGFLRYWTEKDGRGKQRWKKQETWETGKRLATWAANDEKFSNGKSNQQTSGNYSRPIAAKDSTDLDLVAAVVGRHAPPGGTQNTT